jgi:hypothetical protein
MTKGSHAFKCLLANDYRQNVIKLTTFLLSQNLKKLECSLSKKKVFSETSYWTTLLMAGGDRA